MRQVAIIIVLLFYFLGSNSQVTDYENKLAQYMAEFKANAFSDASRMDLFDRTEALKNQIEIQVNLSNSFNDEYKNLVASKKKIKAFYDYLGCFSKYSNNEIPKEEFDYVNEILNIYPRELVNLTCSYATCYEITINKFKAILVQNKLKPTDNWDYRMIEVEYDCLYDGKPFQKGKFNIAGNNIQVIQYMSDKGNPYYNIIAVRCKETK